MLEVFDKSEQKETFLKSIIIFTFLQKILKLSIVIIGSYGHSHSPKINIKKFFWKSYGHSHSPHINIKELSWKSMGIHIHLI